MRYAAWITKSAVAVALLALGVSAALTPAEAKGGPPKTVGRGNDKTAPTITCPSGITTEVQFSSSSGAYVWFSVTATDDKDPSPTLTVSPPSYSLFPVGTTTVTATATDWKGNTSTRTFGVTVLPFTQTVLPPEGVRTYKAYWVDSYDWGYYFFEWDITVAADGTVSGTGVQTELLTESFDYYEFFYASGPLPSGLSGEGVVSGTIAADGSGQFTASATYWVWVDGDYDADGNPVYTQRTASFSGAATAAWDSSANLWFSADPLAAVYPSYSDGWYVQ